jgi:hypothetical protein
MPTGIVVKSIKSNKIQIMGRSTLGQYCYCVSLYFRFALSFRDVEEMLAMRGVALTYETVRECPSLLKTPFAV